MDAPTLDPILAQIAEIRQRRAELDNLDWSIPEAPDYYNDIGGSNQLMPLVHSSLQPLPEPIDLETVKAELPRVMLEYANNGGERAMLVKVPAGAGKTHAGITVAQELARSGRRVLWCVRAHDVWGDLLIFEHFDLSLWYHWQSTNGEINGQPACRYSDAQRAWTNRGYKAMDLCLKLCRHDGWIGECPYRAQAKRREPIVFAMHQHLTVGLSVADFDVCVVDELPLAAFISDRRVPVGALTIGGAFSNLMSLLRHAAVDLHGQSRLAGKALLDLIGPELADVYAQIETVDGAVPLPPDVYRPSDVEHAPYWFALPMLNLLSPEYEAWKHNWPMWAERVWLTAHNLHLLDRADVWDKLPRKLIALDATAHAELYKLIFGREIEEYQPNVQRQGKLYQCTKALNGKFTLLDGEHPNQRALDLRDQIRAFSKPYTAPAVICHKALAPMFAADWGAEAVRWFGNLRGTNDLDGYDILNIAGVPGPEHFDIIDMATALDRSRIQSFFTLDDCGKRKAIFTHEMREYRLSAAGLAQIRAAYGEQFGAIARRIGVYSDRTLEAVHSQLREAELVQSIHRARINVHPADVMLYTSIPTAEPLDAIFDVLPIAPTGIPWKLWTETLEPWLAKRHEAGETITYAMLAHAVGLSEKHVRAQKWLDSIAMYQPSLWQAGSLEPAGGRPKKGLLPLSLKEYNY